MKSNILKQESFASSCETLLLYVEYNYIKRNSQQNLDDYQKALNKLICSHEFKILISGLINNIFLERSVYDLLRIADKQYDKIETIFSTENLVEQAYSIASDSEDDIKQYSLNIFEIQTAITDFCKNFTKLEEIKKCEQSEQLYRKVSLYVYCATRPMFENKQYSVEKMESGLCYIRESIGAQIKELLKNRWFWGCTASTL